MRCSSARLADTTSTTPAPARRLRPIPTDTAGCFASIDDVCFEPDRLLERGEITPYEHGTLLGFCVDFTRAHRQPKVTWRYEPVIGGRSIDEVDDEAVAAQVRMNFALRAASPDAGLLVGLAVGECLADQAHRRGCSRASLLTTLKTALRRVMRAKRLPHEPRDE